MQLRSGEKKAIAIIVVVAVLFVAVVGGTVAALTVGRHHDEGPHLQLAVGDRLVRVEPSIRCDVFGNNCEPKDLSQATFGHVPVPVGESVLMSVSADIARQPWTLVTQYAALLETEGVKLDFKPDAIAEIAKIATFVNSQTENIGARRLHTIMELMLEDVSFSAPELEGQTIPITVKYVQERLKDVLENKDLSKYIL